MPACDYAIPPNCPLDYHTYPILLLWLPPIFECLFVLRAIEQRDDLCFFFGVVHYFHLYLVAVILVLWGAIHDRTKTIEAFIQSRRNKIQIGE